MIGAMAAKEDIEVCNALAMSQGLELSRSLNPLYNPGSDFYFCILPAETIAFCIFKAEYIFTYNKTPGMKKEDLYTGLVRQKTSRAPAVSPPQIAQNIMTAADFGTYWSPKARQSTSGKAYLAVGDENWSYTAGGDPTHNNLFVPNSCNYVLTNKCWTPEEYIKVFPDKVKAAIKKLTGMIGSRSSSARARATIIAGLIDQLDLGGLTDKITALG